MSHGARRPLATVRGVGSAAYAGAAVAATSRAPAVNRRAARCASALMPSIGPMELIIVAIVALVILGPKRLPSAARSLGESVRGFKDSIDEHDPRKALALDDEKRAERV